MTRSVVCSIAVLLAALVSTGFSWGAHGQPPPMAVVSPDVHADRTVTFRLLAPNAKQVSVNGEFEQHALAMVRDDSGVWSVTVGPLEPNIYGYGFQMDGLNMPDPCNTFVRVGALAYESQVEIPGEAEAYQAIRDVPHGEVHEHWYHSNELNAERRFLVYTPPGYGSSGSKHYPVLYLLHGMGDDEGFWTSVGRANFIMDNLIAEHKAKPALIVMPFGHASRSILGPGRRPGTGPPGGSGVEAPPPANGNPIGTMFGIEMMETELKQHILPLVEQTYRVSHDRGQRAIAGLSMGGYQALDIGLNNPQLFSYVAGFSSALVGPKFETNVQPLLAGPAKANQEFRLVWLGCGSDDGLLPVNQQFEQALTAAGVRHEWHLTPGYGHWWTLWRMNLRDLMPQLFAN